MQAQTLLKAIDGGELPEELVHHTWSFFSLPTLKILALVNRRFLGLCNKLPIFASPRLMVKDMWPLHTSPLVYLKTHLLASGKTTEGRGRKTRTQNVFNAEADTLIQYASMQEYTTPFDPTTIYHLVTLSSVLFLNFSTFEPWNLLYFFSALVACQFADWAMDKHEIGFIPHITAFVLCADWARHSLTPTQRIVSIFFRTAALPLHICIFRGWYVTLSSHPHFLVGTE